MLPFRVVERDDGAAVQSDVERGRQLFVAKGCVSCHAKLRNDQNAKFRYADFGPSLVGRPFPVDYLTMKIKNPAEGRTTKVGEIVMPQLELDVPEVEALVHYLSGIPARPAGGVDG